MNGLPLRSVYHVHIHPENHGRRYIGVRTDAISRLCFMSEIESFGRPAAWKGCDDHDATWIDISGRNRGENGTILNDSSIRDSSPPLGEISAGNIAKFFSLYDSLHSFTWRQIVRAGHVLESIAE